MLFKNVLAEGWFDDVLKGLGVKSGMSQDDVLKRIGEFDGIKLRGALKRFKKEHGWRGEEQLRNFLRGNSRIAALPDRERDMIVDKLMASADAGTAVTSRDNVILAPNYITRLAART